MSDWKKLIPEQVDGLAKEVIEIRRDLHRHPEVSGKEERTSALVANYLSDLGMQVRRCRENYGVVGLLQGAKPGPTVALRADMDALPLIEATGVEYASQVSGVMHACGHDLHTAIPIGYRGGPASFEGPAGGQCPFPLPTLGGIFSRRSKGDDPGRGFR